MPVEAAPLAKEEKSLSEVMTDVTPTEEDVLRDHALLVWSHLSHDDRVSEQDYMAIHGSRQGLDHGAIWGAYESMCLALWEWESLSDQADAAKEACMVEYGSLMADKKQARKIWSASKDKLSKVIFG